MGTVVLHHGTGAQDFEPVEPALAEEQEAEIFFNVQRVLAHRDQQAASDLLHRVPFKIFRSTNSLGDDFCILYTELPLDQYDAFLKSQGNYREAAKQLAETVAEVKGPWVRFVAIGLRTVSTNESPPGGMGNEWDVFISYASEDREAVADPLARLLAGFGLRVWYDQTDLKVGDSLRKTIDTALAQSRYGVVILSKHFFSKHYPNRELDGLAQREVEGRNVILPVWHDVTDADVRHFSPPLADRVARKWSEGAETVAWKLLEVIWPEVMEQIREAGKRIEKLPEISSGKALAQVVERAQVYNFANDDLNDEAEANLVGGFLQELEDWGNISSMIDVSERVRGEVRLGRSLREIQAAGWKVFGRLARQKIVSGERGEVWSVANIVVARHDVSDIFEVGDGRFGFFRTRPDGKGGNWKGISVEDTPHTGD